MGRHPRPLSRPPGTRRRTDRWRGDGPDHPPPATYPDLERYCYRVALDRRPDVLCMHRRHRRRPPGRPGDRRPLRHPAGLAMQSSTNILRDVGEDARAYRIYLPPDELHEAGYSEADLLSSDHPAFPSLDGGPDRPRAIVLQRQPRRSPCSTPDSRFAIAAAAAIYRGILPKIVANDYDVSPAAPTRRRAKNCYLPRC
ncbi:MAG: squalene/phytoene synthase family protein [Thermomicrobiales bacterium]